MGIVIIETFDNGYTTRAEEESEELVFTNFEDLVVYLGAIICNEPTKAEKTEGAELFPL